ncbi:RRXRR domain-containing protein [Endozoicomonas sp. 4G]|uniref:RRXRR domain-containing protein n=1 Tax=Endozoicomonas sp. 4G TaxID=2872754 RepID=UPI002078A54B|nr:RRXRR domain-containing protein [Endozoicomonas sp. 4G]
MNRVFVFDKNKKPLMPCHPARARKLLDKGKAAVFRRYPFTIILKEREGGNVQPLELKFDVGSKTTGIAVVADCDRGKKVVFAAELQHRGQRVKDSLESRRATLLLAVERSSTALSKDTRKSTG